MNKNIAIGSIATIIILLGGYLIWQGTKTRAPITSSTDQTDTVSVSTPNTEVASNSTTIPSTWKTYMNAKYSFGFQYPETWSKSYGETEVVCDLKTGAACVMEVAFMDTASQGIEQSDGRNNEIYLPKADLKIEYHFDSGGAKNYQYALDQIASKEGLYANAKMITVAGSPAIMTTQIAQGTSVKGTTILPKQIIYIEFLDKQKVGEMRLTFTAPIADKVEVANFNKLLTGFRFGETMQVTIKIPADIIAYQKAIQTYMNEGGIDQSRNAQFVSQTITVPKTNDVIRSSAEAAALAIPSQADSQPPMVRYLKIKNGTAYVVLNMDVDGWAGVSFSIRQIHPLVEKTLLQFPEIKNVVFGFAPGDTAANSLNQ